MFILLICYFPTINLFL